MAQVQWQNYDTTIILFTITFWWGPEKITAAMSLIEWSMIIAMVQNWILYVTISPTLLEERFPEDHW